jgi:hypothetical protein
MNGLVIPQVSNCPAKYLRARVGECRAIAFKINGRFMNWWQLDTPDAELSNVEIWYWR